VRLKRRTAVRYPGPIFAWGGFLFYADIDNEP
jgi:hypothetical protein